MQTVLALPFIAGLSSFALAGARVLGKKVSFAGWCFAAGMVMLAIDSVLTGLALRATSPQEIVRWLSGTFAVKSVAAPIWLAFSVTYSRRDYRDFLRRWTAPIAAATVLLLTLALGGREALFTITYADPPGEGWAIELTALAKALNALLLVLLVLTVTNLEQTFRAAVGTMRWQIKFVILAFAVIFGTQIYARSQGILFSGHDMGMPALESGALLIGCVFLALAYARTGLAEIDVYPSLAVVRSSLTVLIVGTYLLAVGVLAQVVSRFGGEEIFQLQAFVVLLGLTGLAVLLLSDRARQTLNTFVRRHFNKAQHDSVAVWTTLSRQLAGAADPPALCTAGARLIAEAFDVLSVTVWLRDDCERLVAAASTAAQTAGAGQMQSSSGATGSSVLDGLQLRTAPFDLEHISDAWAEGLRQANPTTFSNGGNRLCVPLRSGDRLVGAVVLGDRVNAAVYTMEELELLKCIGDQMASALVNLRLADEVAAGRQLEAFRTMSAFFVHDLKNTAASLNLMLKNLPIHFDDPAFREDALRAVGNTARRIDDTIARLGALRRRSTFAPVDTDLNELVTGALARLNGASAYAGLTTALQPVPRVSVDRDQIESVVANLVLNARDAVGPGGRIEVRTGHQDGRVVLSVADNGCGMSPAFVNNQLFRPFQSTKTKGLGLGLFQCRAIVQAHGGAIQAESEPGRGTTFTLSFPAGTTS